MSPVTCDISQHVQCRFHFLSELIVLIPAWMVSQIARPAEQYDGI